MPELAGRERTAPGLVHRVAAELGAVAVFERSEGVQEGAPVGRHGALAVEAEQCQAVSASAASAVLVPAAAALLSDTSLLATAVLPVAGLPAAVVAAAARLQAAAALLRPAAPPILRALSGPHQPQRAPP